MHLNDKVVEKVPQERKQGLHKTYACTDSWTSKKRRTILFFNFYSTSVQFIQTVTQTAVRNSLQLLTVTDSYCIVYLENTKHCLLKICVTATVGLNSNLPWQ